MSDEGQALLGRANRSSCQAVRYLGGRFAVSEQHCYAMTACWWQRVGLPFGRSAPCGEPNPFSAGSRQIDDLTHPPSRRVCSFQLPSTIRPCHGRRYVKTNPTTANKKPMHHCQWDRQKSTILRTKRADQCGSKYPPSNITGESGSFSEGTYFPVYQSSNLLRIAMRLGMPNTSLCPPTRI